MQPCYSESSFRNYREQIWTLNVMNKVNSFLSVPLKRLFSRRRKSSENANAKEQKSSRQVSTHVFVNIVYNFDQIMKICSGLGNHLIFYAAAKPFQYLFFV